MLFTEIKGYDQNDNHENKLILETNIKITLN